VEAQASLQRLTRREHEALQLLVRGYRNEAIAEQLFISAATARTHISNILVKLGVHSQLEAVALAARFLNSDRRTALPVDDARLSRLMVPRLRVCDRPS